MGYLPKESAAEHLVATLRRVMRGEPALSGAMAGRILEAFRDLAEQAATCPLD